MALGDVGANHQRFYQALRGSGRGDSFIRPRHDRRQCEYRSHQDLAELVDLLHVVRCVAPNTIRVGLECGPDLRARDVFAVLTCEAKVLRDLLEAAAAQIPLNGTEAPRRVVRVDDLATHQAVSGEAFAPLA